MWPAQSTPASTTSLPVANKQSAVLLPVAKLWFFCLLLLTVGRLALLFLYRDRIGSATDIGDGMMTMLCGARFDAVIAAWVVLPVFLLGLACACRDYRAATRKTALVIGHGFASLTPLLVAITHGYFREYNNQFDHSLFGLYYDDTQAILMTIWKQYHPLATLGAAALVGCATNLLFRWWMRPWRRATAPAWFVRLAASPARRWGMTLLATIVLVASLRGSVGRRPVQEKDAAITGDELLDKMTVNPYTALRYAIKKQRAIAGKKGFREFISDGDLQAALRRATGKKAPLPPPATVDDFLATTARGSGNPPPDHIFLIVMESYEAWPLFPAFRSLGIGAELAAMESRGLSVRAFLPASGGTMESLAAIVTGLPDAGVHTNYQRSACQPYPTALAATFQRLGYRTRAFYGGYLSWQSFADFCRNQGFDEVHGGGSMGSWVEGNEWGVADEQLFRYVGKHAAGPAKSFNLILTTSFHPPYDVDVRKAGFTLDRLPPELAASCSATPDFLMLGHFWYADQQLGNFVREIEAQKLSRPLFVVTGDHAGRRSITKQPSLAERALVPCVFYGPEVMTGMQQQPAMAGSHIDLAPTLIEWCAPAGFMYHALGHDLLAAHPAPYGASRNLVVTPTHIWDARSKMPPQRLPEASPTVPAPDSKTLRSFLNDTGGIAWWRIMRGEKCPPP